MSASIWHGWYSLVRPLITGTRECGGEALDDVLLEGADHDDVDHARNHLRRILHRFAAPKLGVARVEVDRRAAELLHAGLERQPGARARPSRKSSPACGRPAASTAGRP